MRHGPPFRYAHRSDGRRVAFQVVGDGDLELVFLFGWPTHLGLVWENPSFAGFLHKLSSFSRLILSDRGGAAPVFEDEMDDVRAVMGAVGSERSALFGCQRHWFRVFALSAATLAEQYEGIRALGPVDIRGLLGSVQAPVLVLHRTGDRVADVRASRYMAERIPGARFVELPGEAHFPFFGDQHTVVELTQEFLTGARPVVEPDGVLATVPPKALAHHQNHGIPSGDQAEGNGDARAPLTDLVDSTRLAAELGDRRRHRLLVEHQEVVRQQLARFRGREVKTTGEIVCSRTVKDLVAGSGFRFADRGSHRLKGIPDDWQLYAVELAAE